MSMCTCKSGYSLPIGYPTVTGNRFPWLASQSLLHYLQINYYAEIVLYPNRTKLNKLILKVNVSSPTDGRAERLLYLDCLLCVTQIETFDWLTSFMMLISLGPILCSHWSQFLNASIHYS